MYPDKGFVVPLLRPEHQKMYPFIGISPVAVVGGIAEEAIETVEGVEGGVGEFASEGAGGGE